MNALRISLDDGLTYMDAPNGLRVYIKPEAVDENGKDRDLSIEVCYTHEGVITDLWDDPSRGSTYGSEENLGTSALTYEELVAFLEGE